MDMLILGESPWLDRADRLFQPGIATVFPAHQTLVTLPGIHATQREAFIDHLNDQRAQAGQPPLTPLQISEIVRQSVSLFFTPQTILLRPDPADMEAAFAADELLQTMTSKRHIKFLHATDAQVLRALKQRGECWRISSLPKTPGEMRRMIEESRTAVGGAALYYHNRITGSRYFTRDAFASLVLMPDEALAQHLQEIQALLGRTNRGGYPELVGFQASAMDWTALAAADLSTMSPDRLRDIHADLLARFTAAVPADLRHDDLELPEWRNALFVALIGQPDETVAEEILQGLSPLYAMQLEWLPGCRFENGELLFDTVFDEAPELANGESPARLGDLRVKSFIFNAVREYGELEYINVARVMNPLARPGARGRRGVYLAEIKPKRLSGTVVRIIRMQKWDVDYHLDTRKEMLNALLEAAEYTEYVLDRRLACRQLGMNLLPQIQMHRLSEFYHGANQRYQDHVIWLTYFERDYCPGTATNRIAKARLADPGYALKLAALLGKAAASSLIVGRQDANFKVLFDDGDELVREVDGLPVEIVVTDATGAFTDYTHALDDFAEHYAGPVNRRWKDLPDPAAFAEAYLNAFDAELHRIQQEYRRRRRAFNSLFQDRKFDPEGSMACRWMRVLDRLDATDVEALVHAVRQAIKPQ